MRSWIAENSAALPADKAIPAVLSCMVGGTAGDFAHSHLNTLLRGTGPRTWPAFTELVKKHFQSTNEVIKTVLGSEISSEGTTLWGCFC